MLRILYTTILVSFVNIAFSQMINGGFETYDPSASGENNYSINYALGWQVLNYTPDLAHPSTGLSGDPSHAPRTGNGNARFGFPISNGKQEYFYGQTNSLTAGETYAVSFWVRKDYTTSQNIPMGLHIGSSVPSPQQVNPYVETTVPQVRITPTSTQYVKASFCYTPQTSGTHYVTIGAFGNNPTGESQLFLVDDVSVELLDATAVFSTAEITGNQSIYCVDDNVVLDGSTSTNEQQHHWSLFELNNGSEELIFEQSIQNGEAGQVTINSFFNIANQSPQPGKCYRIYLTTYNSCSSQDFIDFCYEDPNVDFLNVEDAVCEEELLELEVTGDNDWTYSWSTGDEGEGLKSIEVIPSGTSATYSVTVTTPNGCTTTESITFTVHPQNNVAPWMNGINGSGEYTMYVNADPNSSEQINFTSDIFNDNSNEQVEIYDITYDLSPSVLYGLTENGNSISFQWNYGSGIAPDAPPGEYSFTVFLKDDNECENGFSEFTFTIIVICENCPECVSYENRSSSTTPLPPETKAARCIEAGLTQTVDTEDEDVYFQAGEYIELGPYFEMGPGYEGVIEPTTCVTDCEDCCVDWEGFTYDDIADNQHQEPDGGLFDVVAMDFFDNDPTNDIFQLTDINNPYCAYNAIGYQLSILVGYDEVIYQESSFPGNCCNYVSPSPDNPIAHASIWWDGYFETLFGTKRVDELNEELIRYEIVLFGCDGSQELIVGFIYVNQGTKMNTENETSNTRMNEVLQKSMERKEELENEMKLSPNPTRSKVNISGVAANDISNVKIYDDKGIIVKYEKEVRDGQLNVETLKPGTYYCKIKVNGLTVTKKFVKL